MGSAAESQLSETINTNMLTYPWLDTSKKQPQKYEHIRKWLSPDSHTQHSLGTVKKVIQDPILENITKELYNEKNEQVQQVVWWCEAYNYTLYVEITLQHHCCWTI